MKRLTLIMLCLSLWSTANAGEIVGVRCTRTYGSEPAFLFILDPANEGAILLDRTGVDNSPKRLTATDKHYTIYVSNYDYLTPPAYRLNRITGKMYRRFIGDRWRYIGECRKAHVGTLLNFHHSLSRANERPNTEKIAKF